MADRIIGRLAYKIVGDDRDFKKALQKSTRELDKTADRFQQIGKGLSLAVTAPVVGLGVAMSRAAIEAEETQNKFNVAFRGIEDDAQAAADNLSDNFGLANDEAQRLLAGTGDLLKGFGATAEEALGLSSQVQTLAVDLASYNNLAGGTEQASQAITAALLGEREQLKQLGVVIRQTDVDQRLLAKGQQDLTGQARLQAQAQATLELTMEQSTDAIGDYERSGGSAAQQIRELKSQTREMAVELGNELLPVIQSVLSQVLDMVDSFSELDDAQKRTIIQIAAVAAALGPMSVAIGTTIKAVNALKLAAVALGGATGLGLVVLAAGAVVGAVRVIRGPVREARDSLAELADESEDSAAELDNVARALSESEQFVSGFDAVKNEVEQIAEASGRTVDEVLEIGQASSRLSNEYKDQLRAIQDQLSEQREQNRVANEQVPVYQDQVDLMNALNESQQSARDAAVDRAAAEQAALEAQRDRRSEAFEDTLAEYYRTQVGQLELLEKKLSDYQFALDNPDSDLGVRGERGLEVTRAIVAELEEEIQRRRENLGLVDDTTEASDRQMDYMQGQVGLLENMGDRTNAVKDATGEMRDLMRDIGEDAMDFTDVYADLASMAGQAWGDVFSGLGEAIVNTEDGLESVGKAMSNLFVGILKTLGDQFAAMAAAALFGMPPTFIPNPAAAATYGAASAGFYAASGVAGAISAFANGGSFTADQPTLALFGENGPETVDIQPVPKVGPPGATSGGDNIIINGDVYGYNDFAEKVEQAQARSNRLGRTGR